jgi:hypothetical protein
VSRETWYPLERFGEERGYDEWLRGWIEPHWFAWLIAILKETKDTPELFPKWKWATIQRLEEIVIEAARAEAKLWFT